MFIMYAIVEFNQLICVAYIVDIGETACMRKVHC